MAANAVSGEGVLRWVHVMGGSISWMKSGMG